MKNIYEEQSWHKKITPGDKMWKAVCLLTLLVLKCFLGYGQCPATVSTTPNDTVCEGNTVTLTATANAGSTYLWYKNGISTGVTTSVIVILLEAAKYYVITQPCNIKSDSVYVYFNPLPSPSINGSSSVCAFTNGVIYSTTLNSGHTYSWTVTGGTLVSGGNTNQISVNWGVAGTGSVSVTETITSSGCFANATKNVTINALPTPVITGISCLRVGSNNVAYTTSNSGNNFFWAVNGGSIASGQGTNTILVNWSIPGIGVVTVTETNTLTTCAKQVTKNVTVTSVDFSFSPIGNACDGNIQFTTLQPDPVTGMTYAWNFGDLTTGSTRDIAHQFSAFGINSTNYQVKLVVTYPSGCKDSVIKPVNVLNRPDASIADVFGTWKHCVVGSNIAYTLEINNISTTTSTNTHYHIDWGDLSVPFDSVILPNGTSHQYTTIGNFPVILTVTNIQCTATKTYYFFNGSNPKGGIVNPGNTTGLCEIPQVISFSLDTTTLNNPPGSIYTIIYDDGSPNDVYIQPPPATISHTYTSGSCGHTSQTNNIPNSFAIKCIISNPCGQSISLIDPIQISAKPIASFTSNPLNNGCVNTNITFTSTTPPTAFVDPATNACTFNLVHTWSIIPTTYTIISGNLHSTSLIVKFTNTGNYTVSLNEFNGCASDTVSEIICINSPPVSSFNVDKVIDCKPLTVNATNTSTTPNTCGDLVYTWSVVFNGAGTCIPSAGSWVFTNGTNSHSQNASFIFNDPGTYTITLAVQNSCTTATSPPHTITVKSVPKVTVTPIQSICAHDSVHPSAAFPTCYGTITAYSWTFPGGIPTSASTADPGWITYSSPGTYIITANATNECGIGTGTTSLIVNTIPIITANPANQTICAGTATQAISFTSSINPGTTYSWITSSTAGITGAPLNGNSNPIPPMTLNNSTIIPGTVTITITPTANGCTGTPITHVITVNPKPVVTNNPMFQSICSGEISTAVTLTSNIIGTTFAWTASPSPANLTGFVVSGTDIIPAQTIFNPNFTLGTVTYAITPTVIGCIGNVANYIITVKPLPNVSNSPLNKTICSGTNTSITLTSNVTGTTFSWTASCITGTVTGFTSTGSGNINDVLTNTGTVLGIVRYVITPTASGCSGTPVNFDVNVQPVPNVSVTPQTQTICAGTSTGVVTLSSNVSGSSFSWTAVASPSSGMSGYTTSGTGNTIPVMTINSTLSVPGTITYTITPSIGTCNGTPGTHTITVNPAPSVTNNPMAQSICSGNQTTLVNLTSNVSGTTFTWTATAPGTITGWTSSGGNSIPVQTLNNNSNTPGDVIYHIIPSSIMSCPGQSADYIITVKPIPVASGNASQTMCSGTLSQAVNLNSTVAGTTYNWITVSSPGTTGAPANGNSNPIPAWLLTNSTITPGTVTITITPTANGCAGIPITHIINVNPVPTVTSFPLTTQTICSNDSTNIVLSSNISGSVINWTAALSSGTITGFSNGSGPLIKQKLVNTGVIAGIVTYSVNATLGGCTSIMKTIPVTVNPIPVLTTVPAPNEEICSMSNTNIVLNSNVVNTSFSWVASLTSGNAGGFSSGVGSPISQLLINFSNTVPAVITYTITPVFGGCTGNIIPVPVTVNPLPTTYAGIDQVIPYGTATTLTGTAGGGTGLLTYMWTPAGSIVPPNTTLNVITTNLYSGPSTFTLLTTDIKGCTQSDQMIVTLYGSALGVSVTAVPNNICNDGSTVQLNAIGTGGSGNYTYSWTSNPAGSPVWSSTLQNPLVTPTITTIYTVIINDGFNTATNTGTVTVNPLPFIYTVTGGGQYCSGGDGVPIGLQNSENGVSYRLYHNTNPIGIPVPGIAGPISFGNQTLAGTYKVKGTRTSTGCLNWMADSAEVIILPLPNQYTVTGGGSYPAGGIGVLVGLSNSQTGVEYELENGGVPILPRVTGTNSPISFGRQTAAGTYTVTAYSLTNPVCTALMLGNVTIIINPWPTAFNVYGGGNICADDSTGVPVGIDGSEIGVNYQLKRDGNNIGVPLPGTGDSILFGHFHVGVVYTVLATNTTTNLSTQMNGSAVIIINPLPIPYVMGSYGDDCPGSEIMLNGSQWGVNYVLRLNLNPVMTLPGTGTVLNFGPQNLPGNYTIYAYFVVTGCDTIMDGSITINPSPNLYNIRPPGVSCACDTVSITGSQVGIIYQLQRNGSFNVGPPLPGTGSPIYFGPQCVPGIYTVLAINPPTNCKILMNGTANLNPLPSLFTVVPNGDTCAGVALGLSGSQLGVKYILKRDTLWMDTINGTGSPIYFGIQTIPGIYTIVGYDTTTFKFCQNLMLGSTILHPGPVPHPIIPSGFNCVGDVVGLANSDVGVSYQLIRNGNQNAGAPVLGTGGPIWFGVQNYPGTYTVIGQNTTTNCSSLMTGTCILTSLPIAYNIIPQGDTCAGTSIGVNGSQTGVHYRLLRDNISVTVLPGTGGFLSFGPQTIAGTYTVIAFNVTADSCEQLMSGSTIIHQGPLTFNVIPTGVSCAGAVVGLSGSQAGMQYQLFRDGIFNIGPPVPGTGLAISFGVQLQPGIYTVIATSTNSACWSTMTDSATLSILPAVYLITPQGDTCAHSNIELNGSQVGIHYTLFRDIIYPVVTVTGTGGPISFGLQTTSGVYTVTAYNSTSDSCHSFMQGSLTIHPNPVIYNIVPSGVICGGSNIGLSFSQTGINYQLFLNSTLFMTLPGNGAFLDFGPQQFPGVYTILAIDPVTSCWSNMNGSTTLHLSPTAFTMIPTGDTCELIKIGLNGSQTGINYILKRDGIPVQIIPGTGLAIQFSYNTTSGTYSIIAQNTTTDTCTSLMNGSLVIHPLPLAYNMTPQGANCEPTDIGLNGSQTGVNYELFKNGLPTGIILPGTGNALAFPTQMGGVYAVLGKYGIAPFCSHLMADSVVVSARPVISAGPNDSVCNSALTYQLAGTGSNYSSLLWTTSGDGFFTNGNTLNAIYHIGNLDKTNNLVHLTISANGLAQCPTLVVTDMMTLIIDPLPVANAGQDIQLCHGQIAQLNGSAQHYSNVQWTTTGDGLFSNNAILNPTYTPGSNDVLSATVSLILTVHGSLKCQSEIHRDTVVISIFSLPTAVISGSANICEADTASITVNLTGTPPWSITYSDGTSPTTINNIGFSPFILQVNPLVTTSYTLTGVSDAHCTGTSFTGTAMISVHPKPLIFDMTVTNGGAYCEGGTGVIIGLDGSQTGISYQLLIGGLPTGNPKPGTGNAITFGPITIPGIYKVKATNPNTSCWRLYADSVVVIIHPKPSVNFTADSACFGEITHFHLTGLDIGKIALWQWAFGDGVYQNYNSPVEPTHQYPAVGTYTVVLSVVDTFGCTRVISHPVSVYNLPVSFFTFNTPLCSIDSVHFTDLSYGIGGSYIAKWHWVFGDGHDTLINWPGNPNIAHLFPGPGPYPVQLTVTSNQGCENVKIKQVTISPSPVSNFDFTDPCEKEITQFTDLSQTNGGGTIVEWRWNFGDPTSGTNNTSPLPNPPHTFTGFGIFTVRLSITSANGCTDSITKFLTVNPGPVADFSYTSTCLGSITHFTDLSIPHATNINDWDWNFGDGSVHSFAQNPDHLYSIQGIYYVTLKVKNSNFCSHDTTKAVNIIPLPTVLFQTDAPKCFGTPVSYTNLSITTHGMIIKWVWDFGDGSSDTINYPAQPNVTHIFQSITLQHTVRLTVQTTDSCTSFVEQIINSLPTPLANFIWTGNLCQGVNVQFNDQTQLDGGGSIISWHWNFDDPASGPSNASPLQNPVHSFSGPGNYNVQLIVTNLGFCIDTISKTVVINALPAANFTADTVCLGHLMTFTDSTVSNGGFLVSWDWNFGDGTLHGNSQNPSHLYANSGSYNVILTVINSNGCSGSITKTVQVNSGPLAAFINSTVNCVHDSISFTDQSTTTQGYILKWSWYFGDGDSTIINLPAPQYVKHSYANPGNYNVTLKVETNNGCINSTSHQINISDAPLANFTFDATRCQGSAVQFTDQSQAAGIPIMSWLWDFDDPTSGILNASTQQNPIHTFNNPGNYQVSLTVTNINSCFDSIIKTVIVNPVPFASFIADTVCLGLPTQFTDSSIASTGTILSWSWDFGDGSPLQSQQDPVHTYATAGTFNVTLTVTNSAGCQNDTTEQVIVNAKPLANFTYSGHCKWQEIQFQDLSLAPGGIIITWHWDFGDGDTSNVQNPMHAYNSAGLFNVKLKVTNIHGCADSTTVPVLIYVPPTANYTYLSKYCPAGQVFFTDQSTGDGTSIVSWVWTFEAGSDYIGPDPVYTFQNPGSIYPVTLIVTDGNDCSDTITDSVHVKAGFNFTFHYDTVCLGDSTHFHAINLTPGDSLHDLSWNFDDPGSGFYNTSTLFNPIHFYSLSGSYIVRLTAHNSDDCVNTIYNENVIVNPLPVASFSVDPVAHCSGDSVIFHNLSSGNGAILDSVRWRFGDGISDTQSAPVNPTIKHKYSAYGTYHVKLIVYNHNHCIDSISKDVSYACIAASFQQKDTLVCSGSPIIFIDNSNPKDQINKWHWDFGDTQTTDYTPANHKDSIPHIYQQDGTYLVKLFVSTYVNNDTISDSNNRTVQVRRSSTVGFSATNVCLGQPVELINQCDSNGVSILYYFWTFKTNPLDTLTVWDTSAISYLYTGKGKYNVKLRIKNAVNCLDSVTKTIQIYKPPLADFTTPDACTRQYIQVRDKSKKGDTVIIAWLWHFNFPDPWDSISIKPNPVYTYDSAGNYLLYLKVTDGYKCYDTATKYIKVFQSPISAFTITDDIDGMTGKIQLNNKSLYANSLIWDLGNGRTSRADNPIVTYDADGTYTIKLITSNTNNCFDTSYYDYKVHFRGLYIPNAFAPSSTNIAVRLFKPVGINLKEYHIQVFDSWGHLMWESVKLDLQGKPAEGWDGTFNGQLMPLGVYVWKATAVFDDDTIWSGNDIGKGEYKDMGTVTLIR